MSPRQLLRKPLNPSFTFSSSPLIRTPRPSLRAPIRHSSTTRTRFQTLHSRLPSFLQPYTRGLLDAPISHLISFLILHEITAIVPLIGLASLFHYTNWLPETWVEAKFLREGIERFGRYFGRKGWFGFEGQEDVGKGEEDVTVAAEEKRWHVGENGGRILVEVATAYAITKVFLPARILVSVWGTPWFARVFVGRVFGGMKGGRNAAAGLGASAGGLGGGMGKVIEAGKKMPP